LLPPETSSSFAARRRHQRPLQGVPKQIEVSGTTCRRQLSDIDPADGTARSEEEEAQADCLRRRVFLSSVIGEEKPKK